IERLEKLEVRVKELEEQLNLNSQNSSRPPSSDFGKKTRKQKRNHHSSGQSKKKSQRSQGAQPGHEGVSRKQLPPDEVDTFIDCKTIDSL
ncbi:DUF6444 domain-containing protein, partial [Magnetococcales bacterium HHB-1]